MEPTGRYAPSPSGRLHLGNLRTALAAWLFARSQGARFLLRVEDLDADRSREEHAVAQIEDLRAIGLDWDRELPRQSSRGEAYEEAIASLRERGLLYECYCTRREIREAATAPHGELPDGAYPGTCRGLTDAERRRLAAERPAALRVRAQEERVAFADRIAGRHSGLVDDFVVRRNDGLHAYNLAVALDDAEQGIGEVVRGRDLLETTRRQIWLQRRLGAGEVGSWTHLPLVLGPTGERLAKRHGDVTLPDRLRLGESPAEVRAMLAASLGLCDRDERPSPAELVDRFDPGAIPREDVAIAEIEG